MEAKREAPLTRRIALTLASGTFVTLLLIYALSQACAARPWHIPGIPTADLVLLENGWYARVLIVSTDLTRDETAALVESLPLKPGLKLAGVGFRSEPESPAGTTTSWRHQAEIVRSSGPTTLILSQYVIYEAQGVDFHTKIRMPFDVETRENFLLRPPIETIVEFLRWRRIRFAARCTVDRWRNEYPSDRAATLRDLETLSSGESKVVGCIGVTP